MRYLFLYFYLFFHFFSSYAQEFVVSGSVHSPGEHANPQENGVPGTAVRLKNASHTFENGIISTITNLSAQFQLEGVVPGEYLLIISFMGFESCNNKIQVQAKDVELGKIRLEEKSIGLEEVQIVREIQLGLQVGEITKINASAFTTVPNANAENLVKKMPGINIVDGKLHAQRGEVREIMVDEKRFFEADVGDSNVLQELFYAFLHLQNSLFC